VIAPEDLSRLCRDSVHAAHRTARLTERRAALAGMAARSRSSALLPELRLRGARARDESLRLTPTVEDPYRYTQDGGDDFILEARATWKLNRLVFADQEIQVERLELERDRAAERLTARVVALVLAWHHGLSAARSEDEEARARAEFERIEALVTLDVMTAGWFGATAERLVRAKSTPVAPGPRATPAGPPSARKQALPAFEGSDLVEGRASATPAGPCLPMHVTGSKTSCGVSMR
jgi:hypothetical protein